MCSGGTPHGILSRTASGRPVRDRGSMTPVPSTAPSLVHPHPMIGRRFSEALVLATELHGGQFRKGTEVAYVSHLMSVTALVLEDGGDEDEAIAALLHDALEDCAEQITPADLERRFGAIVRALLEACTDTDAGYAGGQKPPWKERKVRYIEHVRASDVGYRVSLADKVHNARSILRDLGVVGATVWERFTGGREGTIWYYRSLAEAFRQRGASGYLIEELERTTSAMEGLPDWIESRTTR
jgi:(p)ppGpp synthase/HD superfamily hydrolase